MTTIPCHIHGFRASYGPAGVRFRLIMHNDSPGDVHIATGTGPGVTYLAFQFAPGERIAVTVTRETLDRVVEVLSEKKTCAVAGDV